MSLRRFVQRTTPAPRRPPREELVNALEFEDVARLVLPAETYSTIADGSRDVFDRILLRPRMLVPTVDLDLTLDLLGQRHFAPILVGPVAEQRRYHADGELATVRGASAARAAVVVSSRSSVPIGEIAAAAKTPLWYSVYASGEASTQKQVQQAVASGCKVVCITVGATSDRRASRARVDWKAVERIRQGLDVPVVIKGVLTTAEAKAALEQGARGIVVSDHGAAVLASAVQASAAQASAAQGRAAQGSSAAEGGASPGGGSQGSTAPIETLTAIADVVSGRAALLVDGSFRRGTDILKALVLGAQAVLVARPVMWGLAAYGADGVQSVIEGLQSALARNMCMIGAPKLESLTRSMAKIQTRRSAL